MFLITSNSQEDLKGSKKKVACWLSASLPALFSTFSHLPLFLTYVDCILKASLPFWLHWANREPPKTTGGWEESKINLLFILPVSSCEIGQLHIKGRNVRETNFMFTVNAPYLCFLSQHEFQFLCYQAKCPVRAALHFHQEPESRKFLFSNPNDSLYRILCLHLNILPMPTSAPFSSSVSNQQKKLKMGKGDFQYFQRNNI